MNRFRQRLLKADARISRAFAEEVPAVLSVGAELRPVTVIFETPDVPVDVPGGGANPGSLSGLQRDDR
ncbi:hypothetical protein N8V40_22400 [Enterobacter hormaechei subsp. steigerwaltii]|nr:hypothetical protein [Enterobacter hormaechei subsp. steigerwaltii]